MFLNNEPVDALKSAVVGQSGVGAGPYVKLRHYRKRNHRTIYCKAGNCNAGHYEL